MYNYRFLKILMKSIFKEINLPSRIYNRDTLLQIGFIAVSVFMATFSWIFTDNLVSKLEEREKQQIELYAETIRYVMTSESSQDINFFFERIKKINQNNTIPVIWQDASGHLNSNNIEIPENLAFADRELFLQEKLKEILLEENKPIEMDMGFQKEYIYYGNSNLLKILRYYPVSQLFVILILGVLGYIFFSYSRRAEQNRVWVGLAKETAHQLGTPISSLTAWMEILRSDENVNQEIVDEISKDIYRLDLITTRFSNIGSTPILKPENIATIVKDFIAYLKIRISTKVIFTISDELDSQDKALINKYLFEWVIENIVKNAVDSISGTGNIEIKLFKNKNGELVIDIADDGKGISQKNIAKIFDPGFSTKQRGWGLGLTLAKRIINNYHGGKLFLKSTEINAGSIFRIILPAIKEIEENAIS